MSASVETQDSDVLVEKRKKPRPKLKLPEFFQPGEKIILPVGVVSKNGERFREVIIDEIEGTDEHILGDKKYAKNAGRAITELLRRVILAIPGIVEKEDPGDLLSRKLVEQMFDADRTAVLFGVQLISYDENPTIDWACEKCGEDNEFDLDPSTVRVQYWSDEEDTFRIPFELPRGLRHGKKTLKCGYLKLLRGEEQEKVLREAQLRAHTVLTKYLEYAVTDIDGVQTDFAMLSRLKRRDRDYLSGLMSTDAPGLDLDRESDCYACGRRQQIPLSVAGFFGSTSRKHRRRVIR